MSRNRKVRRLALQGLCCLDVQGAKALAPVEEFIRDSRDAPALREAACRLLRDVWGRSGECDEVLTRHARNWKLSRLALVDRNILRLGVYEMLYDRRPQKVVITEALGLAREFSSAESARFVNGVLDAVARELREQTGSEA